MAAGKGSSLDTERRDVVAAALRGVAGGLPVVGAMVAEVVNHIIPNQKLERVVDFLRRVDDRVGALERSDRFNAHLQTEEGVDILEEAVVQASRALTDERRQKLGKLAVRALTQEELKYAEARKVLNLLRELTDGELLFLTYYSQPSHHGSEYHRKLMELHPDVLQPASNEIGAPQDEIDRGAIRRSYVDTLVRLGLLQQGGKQGGNSLSPLGKLLLRYIEEPDGPLSRAD